MAFLNDLRTTIRRSSDLSKHSADVFAEAEKHPVQITRRDGEPLVLMSQREVDARALLLQFAADQASCARDLVNAARAPLIVAKDTRVPRPTKKSE